MSPLETDDANTKKQPYTPKQFIYKRSSSKVFAFTKSPSESLVSFPVNAEAVEQAENDCSNWKGWRKSIYQLLVRFRESILAILEGRNGKNDSNEVERRTLRYIPESIEKLQSITNFSKTELKSLYRNFKNECPNGVINEDSFKEVYNQFFPVGDSDMYAHFVFKAFDNHDDGYINFEEFVVGLSSLLRGSHLDRLQWTFRLYDINGDGYITRNELRDVVKSVYLLLGKDTNPIITEESYDEHTERVFNKLDINGDGVITEDEFYQICANVSRFFPYGLEKHHFLHDLPSQSPRVRLTL